MVMRFMIVMRMGTLMTIMTIMAIASLNVNRNDNDDNINMRFSARSLVNTTDFNNNWQHTLNLIVPSGTGNALTMSLQITMS